MTTTIEAPSTAATANDVPLELLSKTSRELAGEIALRARLALARSLLIGAREDLAAAQARVGTKVEVREDDTLDGAIVGHRFLGAKSAGVVDAQARIDQTEREIRELEAQMWPVDDAVLERAHASAEEHEALPSAQLRRELDHINAERDRRRGELDEFEMLLAAARRELADVDDRSARSGESVAKDIAKLEAFVSQREREVRARGVVLQRTLEETEPELRALTSALDVAEAREAAEQAAAEQAELSRKIAAALRRLVDAVDAVYREEAALTALRSDLPAVRLSDNLDRGGLFRTWAKAMLERLEGDLAEGDSDA